MYSSNFQKQMDEKTIFSIQKSQVKSSKQTLCVLTNKVKKGRVLGYYSTVVVYVAKYSPKYYFFFRFPKTLIPARVPVPRETKIKTKKNKKLG